MNKRDGDPERKGGSYAPKSGSKTKKSSHRAPSYARRLAKRAAARDAVKS